MKFLQIGESQSCFVRIRGRVTLCSAGKKIHVASIKDVRANCFYASLLRTQFTGTSCIERARCWRDVEIYSASGHFSIYARV